MHQHESDDDEGFVSTKVQIKAEHKHKQKHKCEQRYDRPIDFQPRFILGDAILKKEPSESYTRFRTYLQEQICEQKYAKEQAKKYKRKDAGSSQKSQQSRIPYKQDQKPNKIYLIPSGTRFLEDENQLQQEFKTHKSKNSSININVDQHQIPGHPYYKYVANSEYALVYSRYRDRIQTVTSKSDDFSSNEINLSKVLTKYDGDHYSILKQFQYPKMNRQRQNSQNLNISQHQSRILERQQNKTYQYTIVHDQNLHNSCSAKFRTHSQHQPSNSHFQQVNIRHTHNPKLIYQSQQLQFDSKFECGNLLYAFKNKLIPNNYVLFMQNDSNTYGYNQWFYFSLRNMKVKTIYKFTIVNFRKNHSLFKQGMKISVFSLVDAQMNNGNGWSKLGKNIRYQKSMIRKYNDSKFRFYSLSFQIEFKHENDYVTLSMNTPYSYSRLLYHMNICSQMVNKSNNEIQWQNNIVAYSISNNAVPEITISIKQNVHSVKQIDKKAIIILARQHPGETLSSFMMEEMLYLLAERRSQSIKWLEQNYVFKIFPMVNVDGVIYGNFRCDLGGFDLNRNWKNPNKSLHPQIFSIKSEIQRISSQYAVQCVLDLHGHSKLYNTFSYACKNNPITARVLSLMISELNPLFHFPYCTFGISKYKQTTARAVFYNILSNQNILTIENSFYGAKIGDKTILYDPQTIGQISLSILQAVEKYLSKNQLRHKCQQKIKLKLQQYLSCEKMMHEETVIIKETKDSGSQSEPYADQISIKEKLKKILPKSFETIQLQLQEEENKNDKSIAFKKEFSQKRIKPSSLNHKALNSNAISVSKKPSRNVNRQKSVSRSEQKQKQEKQQLTKNVPKPSPAKPIITHHKRKSNEFNKNESVFVNVLDSQQSNQPRTNRDFESQSILRAGNQISNRANLGLSFYMREKPTLVPIKLKNDSLEIFQEAYNISKNLTIGESNVHKGSARGNIQKIKIVNYSQYQDVAPNQFPLLCILSQEKKKNSKIQRNLIIQRNQGKVSTSLPHKRTYVQNEKLQHIKKSNRKKNSSFTYYPQLKAESDKSSKTKSISHSENENSHLISRIWRQNFIRYGRDLNVFFGDMKH